MAREHFVELLHSEQRRTERSGRPFVFMLLDHEGLLGNRGARADLQRTIETIRKTTRATDIKGWYRDGSIIGVIFTEVAAENSSQVKDAIASKMVRVLSEAYAPEVVDESSLSFRVFPDGWFWRSPGEPGVSAEDRDLYENRSDRGPLAVKRFVDIAGSLGALLLLAPVFIVVAAFVKLTSRGPIIFRQQRVGQFGRPFQFFKFRSMKAENDPSTHEKFVKEWMAGDSTDTGQPFYKIRDDPRVTKVGKFLRRTSLDELPQFINVLKGDMSLVGPRPPIGYELQGYRFWHLRRLAVKPGITGIWQVEGRSRVKFDEMVRMDLRYVQNWSVWLDLTILWRTPGAVARGGGAV